MQQPKIWKMATRKVITVDEVVEKQHSDSEDGMSENDDNEDDFDGYLEKDGDGQVVESKRDGLQW